MWDAVWTERERHQIIHHTMSCHTEAITMFESISKRVIRLAHLLKNPRAKRTKVSAKSGCGVLGLGKLINGFRFNINDHVPNWNKAGQRAATTTLEQLASDRQARIEGKVDSDED
jgi:hypothetical protein